MANAFYQLQQTQGSFLANRMSRSPSADTIRPLPMDMQDDGLEKQEDAWWISVPKHIAAAPVEVVDSMGALFPGIEKGEINEAFYDNIGLPGAGQWYRENKDGVELVGGIAGAVVVAGVAEIAAARVVASGWFAATGVGRATSQVVNRVAVAQQAAQKATLAAAAKGVPLGIFEGANGAYISAAMWGGVGRAAVGEVAIAATLNQNSAIWSDDMTVNMLFGGLGLGIGGVVGRVPAKGQVMKWANSEEVRMLNRNAVDPAGFTTAMERSLLSAGGEYSMVPKLSSELTTRALDANIPVSKAGDAVVRVPQQVQLESEVQRLLQRLTTAGTPEIPNSGFSTAGTPTGQVLHEAMRADPTTFLGAASVASIRQGSTVDDMLRIRQETIDSLDDLQKARTLNKQIPMVYVKDLGWIPPEEATKWSGYRPGRTATRKADGITEELTWASPYDGTNYKLREDGRLSVKWESLSEVHMLEARDAMNDMLTRMRKLNRTIALAKSPRFIELDFAVEYIAQGGKVDLLAAGFESVEAMQLKSLQLKARALKRMGGELDAVTRFRLNLPAFTSAERVTDELGVGLKQVVMGSLKSKATYAGLQEARKQLDETFALMATRDGSEALDGGLFNFGKSSKGEWAPPILGFFDDTSTKLFGRVELETDVAFHKLNQVNSLAKAPGAALTKDLTHELMAHPATRDILDVSGLANNQQAGGKGLVDTLGNQLLTAEMSARHNPVLSAAIRLRRVVNRIAELHTNKALRYVAPNIDSLGSESGRQSRAMLNAYTSFAGGWDIARTVDLGDGLVGFALVVDSKANAQRLGRAVTRGELLTSPATGKPLALDALANDTRIKMEKITTNILNETNAVRVTMGYEPIKHRKFYVPPKSTEGKRVGFTINAQGKLVPYGGVVADTAAEFDAAVAKLRKSYKNGEQFHTIEAIRARADLWDQLGMDFVDPTRFTRRASVNKGALQSSTINPRGLEESVEYIKRSYEQAANAVVRTLYESQLKAARMSSAASLNMLNGIKESGAKNVFDAFQEALMGIPAHANPRGASELLQAVDSIGDKALVGPSKVLSISKQHIVDLWSKLGRKITKKQLGLSFDDMAQALGEYTPFAEVNELELYKRGIDAPWKTKELAMAANKFQSGMVLRWIDSAHAIMNMSGLIVNMPAIVGQANVPLIGKVGKVGVVDSAKIIANGLKRGFRTDRAAKIDQAYMIKHGHMTQDVADLNNSFAMMTGRSRTWRIIAGDPKYVNWRKIRDPEQRRIARLKFLGIEGLAAIITDTSENWSRQIAHHIGLELADLNGVRGLEARHAFAEQIANQAIANYNPLNRPELFQSGLGSMYGLFLSYAQNYNQRLYSWLEAGDIKAVGKNLGMQASLFGFTGLPGYNQLATLLGGEEDNDSLLDGIYKRFGPATGAVIANGGFNELTTILGLPAMGIASRGDANIRHPGFDMIGTGGLITPTGLQGITDIAAGLFEVYSKAADPNIPMTQRHAAEIIARQLPSRAVKGMITVGMLEGQEADAYGNLMSETRNGAESFMRVMGIRSSRQQRELEAYFQNQKLQQIDGSRLSKLRSASRALIRSGRFDDLTSVFEDYVYAGGQPANYANWIRGLIREANNTRTENQLMRALRSPSQQQLARRIELYTGM